MKYVLSTSTHLDLDSTRHSSSDTKKYLAQNDYEWGKFVRNWQEGNNCRKSSDDTKIIVVQLQTTMLQIREKVRRFMSAIQPLEQRERTMIFKFSSCQRSIFCFQLNLVIKAVTNKYSTNREVLFHFFLSIWALHACFTTKLSTVKTSLFVS